MKLQILTWTPSRFAKWKQCPAKVRYEDLLKMCPVCFKGRVSGGFDGEPVVCDTCDLPQPERAPLERGSRLDDALTSRLTKTILTQADKEGAKVAIDIEHASDDELVAHRESFAEATRHPEIAKLVKKLAKTKGVTYQESIVLDKTWKRVSQFTKGAWARLKLDVLWLTPKRAKVIDWKSGNIDKGQIREKDEYHDSMRAYQMAVLASYPQAECEATMAFLDAPPKLEKPFKSLPVLKRADLADEQRRWEQKIDPMMRDDTFVPRPGFYCNWCDFSKKKGGPCPY